MTQSIHKNAPTGCFDMHRNPIYEGQYISLNNDYQAIKPEYKLPIYRVKFDPPKFTLQHVGGGKDPGSHDFTLRYGGVNGRIEIVPFRPSIEDQLGEALDILSTLRDGSLSRDMCDRIDALLNGEPNT